jgi:streptomycin 6-kinase
MTLPASLSWWHAVPGGQQWLDRLPAIVETCAKRWSLTITEVLPGGNVALVVAVTRHDGSAAVLKVSFPDEESEHEADALAHWQGNGAVRVLERDDGCWALLLERVAPGTPLWEVDDDAEATTIASGVLRRLHSVPPARGHPFRLLADVAARWAETIPEDWDATGRRYTRRLVDIATEACRTLGHHSPDDAVLHQDFHGGNVLRSGEDGWLVIDPKPLVGDPAFDAASLLRDRRWELGSPDDLPRLRRRLEVLADVTGFDRERMRLWGIVHALAWGVSGRKLEPDMVRCAELLARL